MDAPSLQPKPKRSSVYMKAKRVTRTGKFKEILEDHEPLLGAGSEAQANPVVVLKKPSKLQIFARLVVKLVDVAGNAKDCNASKNQYSKLACGGRHCSNQT